MHFNQKVPQSICIDHSFLPNSIESEVLTLNNGVNCKCMPFGGEPEILPEMVW